MCIREKLAFNILVFCSLSLFSLRAFSEVYSEVYFDEIDHKLECLKYSSVDTIKESDFGLISWASTNRHA